MGADLVGADLVEAHIDLLRLFLTHREDIVERIEGVLNAQRRPLRDLQNHALLSGQFEDCFFARVEVSANQARLGSQLEEAHSAGGFRPRQVHDLHNDLIHPAEMMIRAFYCWQQTRWPGRNGRLHYAHTLFNLYVLRHLQFLNLRLGDESPSGRLSEIQGLLDDLWRTSPADQPAFVRDARWLIPLAQSLITDELAPYFEIAKQVTETLPQADVIEIWKAHVRMLGGHLTSQIRHYCTRDGLAIDHASVVLRTRASNALDFALLVQGLVELLKAYGRAFESGDERMRLDMAGAIYQGISADPELFLNRLDLLNGYCMIEHVFIAGSGYSNLGQRQVQLQKEYGALIAQWIKPLRDDFPRFRPVEGGYSPYGVVFGLPSHLIEHMALKALEHDAENRFSLENVFEDDGATGVARLAWVDGWRKLPHIDREVQRLYEYPQQFAKEIYDRIEHAFMQRDPHRTGRLYIVPGNAAWQSPAIPELPARYFSSSDSDRAQLLAGRREGHFLVSFETPDGWIALKKDLLTEVLGAGRDARIAGLPLSAAQVLRLMCGDLAIVASADQASL